MRLCVGRYYVAGCMVVAACELAAAADISYPVKAPLLPEAPPSWAGFYLGGQFGYGNDSVRWRNLGASTVYSPLDSLTRDHGGSAIGGGQVGYNFQDNRVVVGIEASMSAANFNRS